MKIRFDSNKERDPAADSGLRVLYAPSKRVAFRLRWYLILLLVASPLMWFFGRLALGYVHVEAPGQLQMPVIELRALDAGVVAQIDVQPGQRVEAGQPLLRLDNPEWRGRIQQLQALEGSAQATPATAPTATERNLLNAQIRLAQQRVEQLQALLAQGAATRGELLNAQAQLNAQQYDLLAFEQRERQQTQGGAGEVRQALRESSERQWLESRLQGLSFVAPASVRVADTLVSQGENVGPGTLLMRLEQTAEPLLLIYLDPRYVAYAAPGQELQVQMPGGTWLAAHVLQAADSAGRLPSGLQKPFAANQMGLLVPAEFDQPLPPLWRVQQLPVRVRFTHSWRRVLGLSD